MAALPADFRDPLDFDDACADRLAGRAAVRFGAGLLLLPVAFALFAATFDEGLDAAGLGPLAFEPLFTAVFALAGAGLAGLAGLDGVTALAGRAVGAAVPAFAVVAVDVASPPGAFCTSVNRICSPIAEYAQISVALT